MGRTTAYECVRCGMDFPNDTPHTEIVRRDFVDVPQPSRVERLCRDCWERYDSEFLGEDFAELVDSYMLG